MLARALDTPLPPYAACLRQLKLFYARRATRHFTSLSPLIIRCFATTLTLRHALRASFTTLLIHADFFMLPR